MASTKIDLMEFEEALKCMSQLELKDCLKKTLNFLNKNNNECCFSNISPHTEAFLVGLASDTRNLKCKLFNAECKESALEIIEALELNRDVFRWTCAFENGTLNKNLLVYKKIFTTKIKEKPAKSKKSASLLSQRLIMSQTEDPTPQFDIPTGCKIQLLNTTLRFLKTDGEGTLHYPDMPVPHAQYMCTMLTLVNSPKSDLNVGFGFKSLYAPLFEAINVHGLDYEFKISFAEKGDIASLKLKKIRRNKISLEKDVRPENCLDKITINKNSSENSSKSETTLETNSKESNNSLNTSSTSSTSSNRSRTRRRRNRPKLPGGVSSGFASDTLQSLIEFTADVSRASVTFERLTDEEAAFVKGVKTLAGTTSKHGSLEAPLRASLQQLNANITKVIETCKIKIEEGQSERKDRFITLKKVPREAAPKQATSAIKLPTRSRGFAAAGSTHATSKDNLIQFKSAGKLNNASTGEVATTDNTEPATDSAQGGARGKDNLDKRKAKLLEAMSVPVESDKGKRMMELMGWAGGALGARAGGILEPILPAIELPAGAGLGHVPPPKPEARRPTDFRLGLLAALRDLLLHPEPDKVIEYTLPLTKKEKNFVSGALASLNKRKCPSVGVKAEQEMAALLVRDLALPGRGVELRADVSPDLRKIKLAKIKNTQKYPVKLQLSKLKATDHSAMTVLNTMDCEIIHEDAVKQVMATLTHTNCKTPVAIRGRAMRMLLLKRFIDMVEGSKVEREFRIAGSMQKKMFAFLESVVTCMNNRVRCSHVADEEMSLYDDLLETASRKRCFLNIIIDGPSKFVLRKMRKAVHHNRAVPACSKPTEDNNNNNNQQSKSVAVNKIIKENEVKNANGNNNSNLNQPVTKENEPFVAKNNREVHGFDQNDKEKCTEDTKTEPNCDNQVNSLVHNDNDSFKVKEVETQTKSDKKPVNGLVQNSSIKVKKGANVNECDINVKDNVIKSVTLDKDIVKEDIETDDDTENSWSTCSDNEVDLSEFDKEIEELDKALCEVGLGFNVRDSDASVSPTSDSPDDNKLKVKKTKVKGKNNIVVIAPKSPDAEKHTEIFRNLQIFMWNQIDRENSSIPMLKCHGVQNGSLVYYCHDAKDVTWLKKTIKAAKLDLKIYVFSEDFVEERKSRKMAVKINSFMPLDAEKLLSHIEMYNDIDTQHWKVLSYESFDSYVIFIVEVDELSFEYISEDNFSLYMGIDKAQFSIIF